MMSGTLDLGTATTGRILAVAFAAGLSQRLIIGAVNGITGDKHPKPRAET